MHYLINAPEMFLRTIYELEEEGVPPIQARLAERLGQSPPVVGATIARMRRDGLVEFAGRRLELTDTGRWRAVEVVRKHRLAECLLADVIGLEFDQLHAEACRLEHVMSDAVERKLVRLLHYPRFSPFGDPIPGLARLSEVEGSTARPDRRSEMVSS